MQNCKTENEHIGTHSIADQFSKHNEQILRKNAENFKNFKMGESFFWPHKIYYCSDFVAMILNYVVRVRHSILPLQAVFFFVSYLEYTRLSTHLFILI